MLKRIVLVVVLSVFLVGCSKSEGVQAIINFFAKIIKSDEDTSASTSVNTSKFNPEQLALLNDISGIWRSDASELVSILIENHHIIFMIDDEPKEASISEVDTTNGIVNLKMIDKYSHEDVIWTIRKSVNNDKGDFTLKVITHDGESYDLSFVRNISEIDKNRIMKNLQHYQTSDESISESAYQLEELHDNTHAADTLALEEATPDVIQQSADDATKAATEAAAAATAEESVVIQQKTTVNYKTEKLRLDADVQVNNGMLSVMTNKGFGTWQANYINASATAALKGLSSGQCFTLVSKKGFNQTDGRDIQTVYQVSC